MIKRYLSKKWAVVSALAFILAIVIGSIFVFTRNGHKGFIKVEKGTLTENVEVTGGTKPVQSVDLSFDRTGRISLVNVSAGDRVSAGEVLASLDSGDLYGQLEQSLASVKAEQAKLDQLKIGARTEDININNSQVLAAGSDLREADSNLNQAIHSAYVKIDDAIRNQADQFLDDPHPTNSFYLYTWVSDDYVVRGDITVKRTKIENDFNAWQTILSDLDKGLEPASVYSKISGYLSDARTYLDVMAKVINTMSVTANKTDAELSAYRASISTARSEANTAVNDFSSAYQSYLTAKDGLDLARKQLALKQAPATPEEERAQEALVDQAQAQADSIRAQIGKNMIISPINGVVTKQDAKVGETAAGGDSLITVMSNANFEIEANVAEVDVGKLALGNPVQITLDAFPGETWMGKVSYIEQAETLIDGVVNYKIKVSFDQDDSRLKSGLTANLMIETQKRENALFVPQYALIETKQGTFVNKVQPNSQIEKVSIQTGIRSTDGMVEILSGLKEGDLISG